jgi:nitric oxide reductase NorQ protein
VPSTRLLVATGKLIASGASAREACEAALLSPLTDDASILDGMRDLVHASFE